MNGRCSQRKLVCKSGDELPASLSFVRSWLLVCVTDQASQAFHSVGLCENPNNRAKEMCSGLAPFGICPTSVPSIPLQPALTEADGDKKLELPVPCT